MAEVDYSQFYYKRERSAEYEQPIPPEDGRKRGKRTKRPLLVVLVIAVLFALVFFGADFFTSGKLIDSLTASLRGNTYEYYLVVAENSGRDIAYAQSLLVKQGGGSGYIITEGEKYLVVYAVYTDRSEASSVSSKNPNTHILNIGFSSKNTAVFNAVDKAVISIADCAKELEKGNLTESEVYGTLLSIRAEILKVKSEIIETGTAAEINLMEFIMGSIDGLEISKSTRVEFLSDVRYMLSGIVVSMSKAA